jgi:hypothetical protein
MSWPATVIVDTVFLPIYAILLVFALYSVFKHRHCELKAFLFIFVFCNGE